MEFIADQLELAVNQACDELRSLDEQAATHRPAPDRWTIQEVIGHLVDSAANNHQRFIRAQFTSELVFPKYEQNEWVQAQQYNLIPWSQLLEFWQQYNRHLAHVIRQVPATALQTRCLIGAYDPATLEFLIVDYLDHLRGHLQKIRDRLANTPQPAGS
jgi:hypothetical protein